MLKSVKVKNLSKEIGGKRILDKINLVVDRDERVVICGPSGSGKTTLLRCLNGLEMFDSGMVTVIGMRLDGSEESVRNVRLKTGMLFQSYNLFPHLTVLENCTLAMIKVKKYTISKAVEVAMHFLDKVHIGDQADKYPITLSGGQQQRAAIARVLCLEPELLLFDEPTSALDPEMIGEVLEVMNDLSRSGMTMICVTHEMRFARKFADRVVFIDEGKVVLDDTSEAFFANTSNDRVKQFFTKIEHRI